MKSTRSLAQQAHDGDRTSTKDNADTFSVASLAVGISARIRSFGAQSTRNATRSTLLRAYSLVHDAYHAAVPYRTRIVFWEYRRTQTRRVKQFLRARDRRLISIGSVELREIIAQYPEAKGIVIFPPSVEWETQLFQRPHQMALAFASLGYLVLFWVHVDSVDNVERFRKVTDRLHLCNVPPAVMRLVDQPIVISYTYNYNWAAQLRSPRIVYELIDHLEIFNNFPLPLLQHYHERLLRRAEVVVGSANDLVDELRRVRSDAILAANGVDVAHFSRADGDGVDVPADIQAIVDEGKPIIGYYGALAEWFDYDLVRYAAAALPEYNFVLIGPDYDFSLQDSGIQDVHNVHWLGPKAYAELPAYLHAFDVATIPFKTTEALQAVSPIKLFEYMAGERPIVTTDLLECRKYPVVAIARSPEEWVSSLREGVARRQDPAVRAALRATAEQNTWRERSRTLLDALHHGAGIPGKEHTDEAQDV